jgi:AcrR family transcriptional regulator
MPATAATTRSDPRARVLDAMIATVSYRGYDGAEVERVLQSAGVTEALFDEHFADKEDCFLQALDALIARTEGRISDATGRAGPSWPERVRSGLQALLGALAEEPDGARVVLVECLGAGPAASERHDALLRLFPPLLEEGRSRCADPDRLPPDIAEMTVGGIAAILHQRALCDRTAELPRLCGDLTCFALLPWLGRDRAVAAAYPDEAISPPQRAGTDC